MEPMTLGSPVNSPISSPSFSHFQSSNLGINTTPNTGNVGSSYYPSYLMGETQTSLNSRMPPGSISPGRRARQFSASAGLSSPSSPQIGGRESFFSSTRIGGERQGGPPIVSLMGGLPQSPVTKHQSVPIIDHQKIIATPTSYMLNQNPTAFSTPVNTSQTSMQNFTPYTPTRDNVIGMCSETIVESQGSEPLEDTWVTVYGFPVASASYILTQFAQLGTIIDQRQPGLGNWMHLKYQTKLQARKALTKNGKIFNGNIMIGVVPCTDLSITGGNKENISLDHSGIFSPRDNSALPTTPRTPKAHMRPLVQAYNASRSEIEVTPTSNTPKKNDSLVSKAIQHILGV
ncbi:UNVERIFIED_CONTAM: hypothetical protein RMT77_006521 [Armadillidium vulgare]